jgi:hypothetical protein
MLGDLQLVKGALQQLEVGRRAHLGALRARVSRAGSADGLQDGGGRASQSKFTLWRGTTAGWMASMIWQGIAPVESCGRA